MKNPSILSLVLFLLLLAPARGQDVQITNLDMPDPEFDLPGDRVAWQTLSGSELWIADVDPLTGEIENEQSIDSNVVPMSLAMNGPEWAWNPAGAAQVVYARWNQNSVAVLARAWQENGVWRTEELPNLHYPNAWRIGPLGSADDSGAFPLKVVYAAPTNHGTFAVWRELEDPATEGLLPLNLGFANPEVGLGRWAQNKEAIITTMADGNDVQQAAEYDVRTGTVTQLTFGGLPKGDSFMWQSQNPAHNGRYFFFTTVEYADSGHGVRWRGLNVYLENANGGWDLINRVYPPFPSAFPYVISPEPFRFNGRSYISFLVSSMPNASDNGLAEVWIAGADPSVLPPMRVSNSDPMIRKDPEPFIGANTAWIYYTHMDGTARHLRMCQTGL